MVVVNPLSRGVFKDQLTYFSKEKISPGVLVTVPVKNRQINALVVDVQPVKNSKALIKRADFSLKKVTLNTGKRFFEPSFLKAARQTAEYHCASVGQTLKVFVPQEVLRAYEDIEEPYRGSRSRVVSEEDFKKKEDQVVQENYQNRVSLYKSLIRETFAQGRSVFLLLPTAINVDDILPRITKGIEDRTFVLHNKLSKKELIASWNKALSAKYPILAILTPGCLSLPRGDLGLVILERENHSAYKTLSRPFLDIRFFVSCLSADSDCRVVMGDQVLSTETVFATGQGRLTPVNNLKFRFIYDGEQKLIDLNQEAGQDGNTFRESVLSQSLKQVMSESRAQNDNMLIISGRRGLAPVILCQDCKKVVSCPFCEAPAILHEKNRTRYFKCHKCGNLEDPEDRCFNCGGWRLINLGSGIDKLAQEVKLLDLYENWWQIDSDSTTPKQAKKIIEQFLITPGSLLIGTEMTLQYLSEPVARMALVAIDPLFALPEFRINEKIINFLMTAKNSTTKQFIIQTARSEEKIFDYVLNGNLLDFFRDEIDQRKKVKYPPFRVLIKITRSGYQEKVERDMLWLKDYLSAYQPLIYSPVNPVIKGHYRLNALIRLKPDSWPDKTLLNLLYNLSPDFVINVDPREILS